MAKGLRLEKDCVNDIVVTTGNYGSDLSSERASHINKAVNV
jgi:hypothetical protein